MSSSPLKAVSPLRREVGLFGAVMMGLGSIIGTGIFVSIALAAGVAGPSVVVAIPIAAAVAACNGMSSAQLAANHPVSGGTYEYGYRWLNPRLGFLAGWMFLCAKSASAATAALGLVGYLFNALRLQEHATWRTSMAAAAVAVLTILVLSGIRRSNRANILIVSVTLLSLLTFVLAGLPTAYRGAEENLTSLFTASTPTGLAGFLEACALMFVAYTGYGRIATLGEEVHDPRRIIPRAIIVTLLVSTALYASVGVVAVAAVGSGAFAASAAQGAAPLEFAAEHFSMPGVATVVAVGAVTAMLGVLLNLILGLSRVVLAMGRRGDLPSVFSRLNHSESTPGPAVIFVGVTVAALSLIGDVKITWSFSAFTVLIYYALTNLAALRLSKQERLYPPAVAWMGLASCMFLAFWVERRIWLTGLGFIAAGILWHEVARRYRESRHVVGPNQQKRF